jgi:trk system potassium uptake protein TrkA
VRVLIVGAGEVGASTARSLADSHEVVVVDRDPDHVEQLTYSIDALPIHGDGTDLETLREAEVEQADIVVASTDVDEVNLAICGTVKAVTDALTIARVKRTQYLDTWSRSRGSFGVDVMVCTDLLTAQAIVRVIGLPTARDVDPFADGRVQMAEFEVPAGSPIADLTVREADHFDALTFVAVFRTGGESGAGGGTGAADGSANGGTPKAGAGDPATTATADRVELARGDTVIRQGDRVVVIGRPESVRTFAADVAPVQNQDDGNSVEDAVIVGGSAVGQLVAELLSERGYRPQLVEQDPERARELAEDLPRTTVLEHDATDLDFLDREDIGGADVVITALESDERTLLVSLLARLLGVDRTIAVVDAGEYVDLFEAVGVDVAVNPREVTAEEITRFTREERAENVAILESDRAEVMEIEVDADSVLVGRPIRESVTDLPEGVVVGALARGDDVVTPRGDTVVEAGDNVVLFVHSDAIEDVTALI